MSNKYYIYETLDGDTFDSISLDFYNSEFYSHEIMKLNPDCIGILIFESGVKLKIPVLNIQKPSTLPPWKR